MVDLEDIGTAIAAASGGSAVGRCRVAPRLNYVSSSAFAGARSKELAAAAPPEMLTPAQVC